MSYTSLLLDLDHTLFDSDASEAAAFSQALGAAGIAEPGRYIAAYRKINLELWAAVERGELTPHHLRTSRFERLAAQERLDADPEFMADAFVAGLGTNGDLYDGAREVLEQLSEHVTLALLTNGLGEVQRARIERLGIDNFFDAVVISAEVGVAKPGTDIFDIVFEKLDFPARDVALMVGDSLSSDIQGGTNYGIDTCWYNPHGKTARPSDRISHEIAELEELPGLLGVGSKY